MKINIGVIFGGESVEHEISIISALNAIENLDKFKYNVIPIYISKDRLWYTGNYLLNIDNYKYLDTIKKKCIEVVLCKKNNKFCLIEKNRFKRCINILDIAIPIVHGQNVEDGTLTGYLETIGIPYVGSNVLGSSIGQDKVILKDILKSNNIKVVDYIWFYDYEFNINTDKILDNINNIGYPVIVKPANLGSSIGINYVSDERLIIDAINEAMIYDKKIIVEKSVDNLIEVNQSVLGDYEEVECSLIEEVIRTKDILTYKDKYIRSNKTNNNGIINTKRIIPANIDKNIINDITKTSKKVFKVLNLSGVVRIDYLINEKTKEFYVNEPNTIPGSLSYYLWEKSNISYSKLLDKLINIGIKEYKNKRKKLFNFDTNILINYNKNSNYKDKL